MSPSTRSISSAMNFCVIGCTSARERRIQHRTLAAQRQHVRTLPPRDVSSGKERLECDRRRGPSPETMPSPSRSTPPTKPLSWSMPHGMKCSSEVGSSCFGVCAGQPIGGFGVCAGQPIGGTGQPRGAGQPIGGTGQPRGAGQPLGAGQPRSPLPPAGQPRPLLPPGRRTQRMPRSTNAGSVTAISSQPRYRMQKAQLSAGSRTENVDL
jgi:hypothetical protein